MTIMVHNNLWFDGLAFVELKGIVDQMQGSKFTVERFFWRTSKQGIEKIYNFRLFRPLLPIFPGINFFCDGDNLTVIVMTVRYCYIRLLDYTK
jgi:hypothetical protein